MHHLVHQVFVHLAVSQGHVSPFIPLFCDARSDNMIIWQQTHYQLHAVLCMKSNCEANINNSGVRLASCGFTMKSFAVTSKCIVFLYNYQPSTSWNGIISFKKILQLLCGDTECFSKRKYLDYDDVLTQSCWMQSRFCQFVKIECFCNIFPARLKTFEQVQNVFEHSKNLAFERQCW